MNTDVLEQSWNDDKVITNFTNEYERIWRFCVGPYVNVKPNKQRFMYLARLRDDIQEAKAKITRDNTRFALEELDKATQRDYPLFAIEEKKGMKEWLQRYLNYPEYLTHGQDIHEVKGATVVFVEQEMMMQSFELNHHFFHYGQRPGLVGGIQIGNLLIYYREQKSSPYWTVFGNKLKLRGSEFWMFGIENGMMKSQPYSQDALKFIMRREKA